MAPRLHPSIEIMGKNLAGKLALIVAVLVIFCFGIVGIPHGGLVQSIKDHIHLGLDLKGGTHLVLEVHVAEAIASATDRDVARLQDDFQKAGIVGPTVGKTDPARPATITPYNAERATHYLREGGFSAVWGKASGRLRARSRKVSPGELDPGPR